MDHPAVHDSSYNALSVLAQLQGDAHWFIRVSLKLHQADAGHVLQIVTTSTISVFVSFPLSTRFVHLLQMKLVKKMFRACQFHNDEFLQFLAILKETDLVHLMSTN